MDILIIKLGAIGDVIRTTAILPGIREKYRNCSVDWVTKKESFGVMKNNNMVNKAYLIDGEIKELENKKYDLVINLDDEIEACELATKVPSKKVVGAYLDEKGNRTYTNDSAEWFDMGLISRFGKEKADELKAKNKKTYQKIIYSILGLEYKKQEPILMLNEGEKDFGKKFAQKNGIKNDDLVIGFNTGAGGRWQDKKLSVEETADLINKVKKELPSAKPVLFGGPEEKDRNQKIMGLVENEIIDAGCDNSLIKFASLVSLCNVLVTSDSLALHIGTAFEKKIVVFFYPTSASEIELYDRGRKIISGGKDYCSYKKKCDDPPKWDLNGIFNAVKELVKE